MNASPGPDATTLRRYERRGQDLGPGEMFSVHDPFRLSNQGEMLPLRLWARPGRENLRLLNALTGCELVSRIHEPESKTLLHQLQRDIALRKPERTSIPEELDFDDDESIVFFECGNVRRELEAIASEIWRLMEASPSLRFNEVAVILVRSRAERYQALIGSVFSEMHHLPYNVVDLPVRSESRLVEACELLLDIPNGRLTRHELLRFITHPTVLASLPDASSAEWAAWCDALGIVHGADRHDHEGTYIRKDVFNWDQGLKRLALGAFMSGERSGNDRLFEQKGDTYLAEEISSDRMASADSFGLLIRSLLADAREAGPVQMTVAAWMDFMSGFISSYVEPRTLEDKRVMRKCLREVAALGSMRVGGKKVGYSVARERVRSALSGLSGSRGQYLVDGIVVLSFLPMRSIPFKVIFVAGMGENHFPATDRKNPLDLGDAQERAGNVSAREQDKYLFLETLLSAREKLYLTYVGRDELTGREPLTLVRRAGASRNSETRLCSISPTAFAKRWACSHLPPRPRALSTVAPSRCPRSASSYPRKAQRANIREARDVRRGTGCIDGSALCRAAHAVYPPLCGFSLPPPNSSESARARLSSVTRHQRARRRCDPRARAAALGHPSAIR